MSPMLVVVPAGMPAVVTTFMPTMAAIPVLAAVKTAVATSVPIMMLAGVPAVMAVVVLGANTTGRANRQQDRARQRDHCLAIPLQDLVHGEAPLIALRAWKPHTGVVASVELRV